MRLVVYTDYVYRREGGEVYAERAFALFVARLARRCERLVLVGREDPRPGRSHYRLPEGLEFVSLPWYSSLARPLRASPAMARSLRTFWQVLEGVDAAWLLGPSPLAAAFALLARARGRRAVLGVRQDLPRYARSRHPERRSMLVAAVLLEGLWRAMARRLGAVVVGPELARSYRRARRLLELSVSLVEEEDIVDLDRALARSYDDELRVLSVGRLETEKNPLLLADILAGLSQDGARWRLVVCGEGSMEDELRTRLETLGVAERAELLGYVPIEGGLKELYRESHLFLHVSLTEGLPQVLFEAFAAGLPTVATAVGGVEAAAGGAAVLVPPADAGAAVAALEGLAHDPARRAELVRAGLERARRHTIEAECGRLAGFLAGPSV